MATEEAHAEAGARLRRTNETRSLAAMLDALPSLVAYVDVDGRSRYANAASAHWWGCTPREAAGRTVADLLGDGYAQVRARVEGALAGVPQRFEHTFVLPDGRTTHTQTEYLPCTRRGRPDGFYVLVTDISRRVRAEAGQQAALAQGALLEERNRTAADLHDHVLQRLFVAGLQLDRLHADLQVSPGVFEVALDSIQEAIEELRTSVRGLALGKGLSFPVTALEQMLLTSLGELGATSELVVRGDLGTLPEGTVRQLLSALAELLAGVGRKHDVHTVRVTVAAAPDTVELRVSDDGAAPDQAEQEVDLTALRSRLRDSGGRLTTRSRHHGGTVTLRLPVRAGQPGGGRSTARVRPHQ